MTLINLDGALPAGNGTGAGPAQDDAARSQAWRREMEAAQMALWLEQRTVVHSVPRTIDSHAAGLPMIADLPRSTTGGQQESAASDPVRSVARGGLKKSADEAARNATYSEAEIAPAKSSDSPMRPIADLVGPLGSRPVGAISSVGLPDSGGPRSFAGPLATTEPSPRPESAAEIGGRTRASGELAQQIHSAVSAWSGLPVELLGSLPSASQVGATMLGLVSLRAAAREATTEGPDVPSQFRAPLGPSGDQDEPLRLHCEMRADGVMVWIGSSAAAAVQVEALSTHLRQMLARQSVRLVSLIHNGQLVPVGGQPSPDLFPIKFYKQESK